MAELLQHGVHRVGKVAETVDEGAIEIEEYKLSRHLTGPSRRLRI